MSKTPEQIEAAITRLMLQTVATELALCAIPSVLTTDQMHQVRDRMASVSVMQELFDEQEQMPWAQELLQPVVDRLHGMMAGAHRKFSR